MSYRYHESTMDCEGCGSTAEDRKKNRPNDRQGTSICPHCGTEKCCMCDMGDDVECGNCTEDDFA